MPMLHVERKLKVRRLYWRGGNIHIILLKKVHNRLNYPKQNKHTKKNSGSLSPSALQRPLEPDMVKYPGNHGSLVGEST